MNTAAASLASGWGREPRSNQDAAQERTEYREAGNEELRCCAQSYRPKGHFGRLKLRQLPPPPRLRPRAGPLLPTSGPAERPGTTAAPQRAAPAVGGGRAAAT